MDVPIKGWTFTHWWVRPVTKVWFHLYHKTVTYSGVEKVDWSKPIIFAPSHQSAFTDALCLILPTRYTNDRFIYPLIRADAFGNNRAIDWMLTAFHMLPVYRPKDNVDIRKRNDSVFSDCYEILSQNRNLLIHPEGNCYAIKKVRRFKKGLARIALGAEELNRFKLDVTVVPVGINYRRLTEARGGIHIQFGNPVAVSDFEQEYREHQASGIAGLTSRVEEEVKQVTVDIQSDEHELNHFKLDVTVVPVGINYRRLTEARGGIHIQFGNPVAVSDFEQEYREHQASGIADLTSRVEEEVKQVTVDIQSDEHYRLIEEIITLLKNSSPEYSATAAYTRKEVSFEKKIIESAERQLSNTQQTKKAKTLVGEIRKFLSRHKVEEGLPLLNARSLLRLTLEGFGYLVSAPLFAYGWINNIIPWYLMHKPASKIDDAQFINSIRMVSGLLIFPIIYLLQTLIFGLATGDGLWTLLYFLSLPASGILSLNIGERWKRWKQRLRLARLSDPEKEELNKSLTDLFGLLDIR